jgi:transposase
MLGISSAQRVFVCTQHVDMRKSFDGLAGCVEHHFNQDPLCGALYVFFNRSRSMVKMLLWDRSGFWVYAKRLEAGRFELSGLADSMQIDVVQLLCILDGIKLQGHARAKRFSLPETTHFSVQTVN